MSGFGSVPFGSSPFGMPGTVLATVRSPYVASEFATTAPRIDPATKKIIVDANGSPVEADGTEQRVLIALSMDKGSSVIRDLGNELRKIDRITDNHQKRVDTTIRAALDFMVRTREIVIVSITVERFASSGSYAKTVWRKTGEDLTRETTT